MGIKKPSIEGFSLETFIFKGFIPQHNFIICGLDGIRTYVSNVTNMC